jgi:tetratricopeptide (TPR) repeat protein
LQRSGASIVPGYPQFVSARARVIAVVAALCAVAAAAVVGIVVAQTWDDERGSAVAGAEPEERPQGPPPLALELGFRDDPEAAELRRASALYEQGRLAQAKAIFDRSDSLEAKVGSAFAAWPGDTIKLAGRLAALNPRSALVHLHLGLARFWAGEPGAEESWLEAVSVEPDTPAAVTASDLLHPNFAPGLPVFVPEFDPPASITSLPPAKQLPALAHAAQSGGTDERLLYGIGLQRVGRPVSAAREFAAAAEAAPGRVDAQVAAAVGRYDKARPEEAFSRLGPLSRRYPDAATVRFHLGLLLLWSGDVEEAVRQLELADQVEPGSPLAGEATRYLERLASNGKG